MVSRAYGKALTEDEIEDVYAAAWAATLSALRGRAEKMSDEELRAYLLTAVASHARKELRRRSRKPSVGFEASHEQAVSDLHLPLPDEAAISAESAGVARDLLVSLPPRRRAVMLLRYGWGLAPREVCALISGLSPRAYRKEVTRGVEQLIERLAQHESGDWCRSREPLLRDYVAGVANEDERLQVEQHLGHCRACSEFASSLTGHLHDFGSGLAVTSAAALIGGHGFGLAERLASLLDAGRSTLSGAVERAEATLSTVAASGGARGGGAAGAGLAAKAFAGGGGAKAALACLGTGAAATACVAAGIVPGVPGVDLGGADDRLKRPEREQVRRAHPQPLPGSRTRSSRSRRCRRWRTRRPLSRAPSRRSSRTRRPRGSRNRRPRFHSRSRSSTRSRRLPRPRLRSHPPPPARAARGAAGAQSPGTSSVRRTSATGCSPG